MAGAVGVNGAIMRFTLHDSSKKKSRLTELSNLRGLAQVRAVGKQG